MYDHLIGKLLVVNGGDKIDQARIVDIDFDIGITIVNEADHDDYLRCLIGPTSFKTKYKEEHSNLANYKRDFNKLIKNAEKGVYIIPSIRKKDIQSGASSDTCAFNL